MNVSHIFRGVLATALLLCLLVSSAWAQTPLTPKLDAELGLYSGCTVAQAMDAGTAEVDILVCGQSAVEDVASYYKDKLSAKGYAMEFEDHSSMGTTMVAATSAYRIAVDVAQDGGVTMANLTLDDLSSSAGDEPDQVVVTDGDETMTMTQAAGISGPIWEIVPMHSGDLLLEEVDMNGSLVAMVQTNLAHEAVLEYYRDALLGKGWTLMSMLTDKEGGMIVMSDMQAKQIQVVVDASEPDQPLEYSVILTDL